MTHPAVLPLFPWRATVATWPPRLRRAWRAMVPRLERGGLRWDQAERLGAVEVALTQPDPKRLLCLESSPPDGIGATPDEIRRYLGGSENPVRVMFEGQVARGRGNPVAADQPRTETGAFAPRIPDPVRETASLDTPTPIVLPMLPRDRSREASGGNSIGYIVRRVTRG